MFRKFSIKSLGIIFSVLLVCVIIIKIIDSQTGDRTIRATLIDIDAEEVSTIKIYPKSQNSDEITLTKSGNEWTVNSNGKRYNGDEVIIKSLITQLNGLKPIRMAATKKEKWAKYEVTDSLATRVVFENNGDILSDLMIGKFSYRQPTNQNPQMASYGQQQGTMNTYVRLTEEDEVYAVSGFLSMSFNKDANAFRNKSVVAGQVKDFTKVVFNYPDSAFTLEKQDNKWLVNGIIADSMKVDKYLNVIKNLKCSSFGKVAPSVTNLSVTIEGANMQPMEVKAYLDSLNHVTFISTINPTTVFSEERSKTFDKLFITKEILLKD